MEQVPKFHFLNLKAKKRTLFYILLFLRYARMHVWTKLTVGTSERSIVSNPLDRSCVDEVDVRLVSVS